jgi:RHS repeat-associated protein
LPALLSDGTTGYLSADAELLAETDASSSAYPIADALGSVRAQTDSGGSLTASAAYDVYGAVRSTSGSIGSLGYTGALTDPSSLVYLQARSLDPLSGTFTSRDPVTPGGPGITGFNPYAYAGQNPATYTDPSGRDVGMVGRVVSYLPTVATAGFWAGVGLAEAYLFRLLALALIVTAGTCATGIACPIDLPWSDTGPRSRPMSEEDAFKKLKENARGFALTDEMVALALRACEQSQLYRLFGDPAVCTGNRMPVIYYGATWTDSGGVKPIQATTLHIYGAQLLEPGWSVLHYDPDKVGRRDWYVGAGLCKRTTGMTCDEYPFFSTKEGGPTAKPQPSVVLLPREETQPQGTSMSSFYWYVQMSAGHESANRYRFGVVPLVVSGIVLPVPTFWV